MTSNTLSPSTGSTPEPIAIVGMGCRFPGGVTDPESFWSLLSRGDTAIGEIPPDRFSVETLFDPHPATPGKIMSRWGGFLSGIDQFDAFFFGIAPREAERLDPQQRLLLETTWEALADAGQNLAELSGSRSGVFVGLWLNDYEGRLFADAAKTDFYMTTGSGRYSASGRLSYQFGWQGPSLTVDTACSSSLVAVHLAVQSLRSGECSLAIAAGANVILQPHITIAYSQSRMMAPDGRCKFGDAAADGYVRSDGAASIVLKRLSDAVRDGDPIRAVILGSAVNNDGRGTTLTTPSQSGQEQMLRLAYIDAGVSPSDVQYVEAHGTGTRAGDPVEIGAIGAVVGAQRAGEQLCRIGSVKTNIGHTEGAAGLAGLMKVVLSMQYGQLPPSLHVQTPNPDIPWSTLGVRLQRELEPWPARDGAALAGVSAFGIAGTNAHIVLASAPSLRAGVSHSEPARPQVLPLSAQSPEALVAVVESLEAFLAQAPRNKEATWLGDVAYTAATRRTHLDYRQAFVSESIDGMRVALSDWAASARAGELPGSLEQERRIAFVFPGQGGQWLGMGRELYAQEPLFRDHIDRCERAFGPFVKWSLVEQLQAGPDTSRLAEIDVVQPALFAIQVSLAALWSSWGVTPAAVIGHSMGEVAAAHVAGTLTLDDAARIICTRSALMKQVSGKGSMALVGLTRQEAQVALVGRESQLSIAVSNGPRSTVIAGDPQALGEVIADLQSRDVFCRPVNVDVAAHSPHMDALQRPLVEALNGLVADESTIPFFSTVTGKVEPGSALDASYWGRNLREPVLFADAIEQMLDAGFDTVIEINPHPILLQAVAQADRHDRDLRTIASLRRETSERGSLFEGLAELYRLSHPIDWKAVYPAGRCVSLPAYPWQRERFWYDAAPAPSAGSPRTGLLSGPLQAATSPDTTYWEATLSVQELPFLDDHRVRGAVIVPAAGFVEMALTAARHAHATDVLALRDITIEEALLLNSPRRVQLVLRPAQPGLDGPAGSLSFQIYSQALPDGDWTLHAHGHLATDVAAAQPAADLADLRSRLTELQDREAFVRAMAARGLDYGPAFQAIEAWASTEREALAEIRLPDPVLARGFTLAPTLLDACFQALIATERDHPAATYLPIAIESLHLLQQPTAGGWAYAVRTQDGHDLTGNVIFFADDGAPVLEVRGLRLVRAEAAANTAVESLLFDRVWSDTALESGDPELAGRWLIFDAADGAGGSLSRALIEHGGVALVGRPAETFTIDDAFHATLDPMCRDDWQRWFAHTGPVRGVIGLWAESSDLADAARRKSVSLLGLVQALAAAAWEPQPRLWVVTRQAVAVDATDVVAPDLTALWGLGGVIAHEHPGLRCARVDVDTFEGAEWAAKLVKEFARSVDEPQVSWRGPRRFVGRLKQVDPNAQPRITEIDPTKQTPFRVVIDQPGVLDHLNIVRAPRRGPGPGQVEIAAEASGLNFINVLSAMGLYPGMPNGVGPLGLECAGTVSAIGPDVSNVAPGDAVLAIAHESLASHVLADARLVVHKPEHLSFVDAATLPIVFVTAWYGLHHLAQLQSGERVLIHAATGGVGLAAIQLARRIGAEVFATAGSPEKRDYLRALGIQYVYDSRSVAFAEQILADTGGQGVDVVLNSLTGAAIPAGLSVLAPYGRFVEIGKRDVYDNTRLGLWPFQKSLSFFMVDLERMIRERPAQIGHMLNDVIDAFRSGELKPLPTQTFAMANVSEAFRLMAQARHIGKLALTPRDANHAWPVVTAADAFDSESTYLITGGPGALGLAIAQRMIDCGARHLILMSRRAPSPAVENRLDELRQTGATVAVVQGDVSRMDDVRAVLTRIARDLPPLRGVIHAAGVLDDGVLLQQTSERFGVVMDPKVTGAWNLHTLTEGLPLDFMLYFSSVASLLGTPGQSNYAAANAFLDGLAALRRQKGLPALSIQWGPWSTVGLAAQGDRVDRLNAQGVAPLEPGRGLAAFERVIGVDQAVVAVMEFDAAAWVSAHPADGRLAEGLMGTGTREDARPAPAGTSSLRDELKTLTTARERRERLEAFVREQTALVLRLPVSRIDPRKPLRTLGFDSLMTLELRNRLEAGLGVSLSATLVWNYPTIADIVPHLAEKLGLSFATADPVPEPAGPEAAEAAPLDDLSAEDVNALLAAELDEIDDLLRD